MSEAKSCGEKNWKRGCIPIESEGDTYFTCLMVTGPDRGRVVYIDYEGSWVIFYTSDAADDLLLGDLSCIPVSTATNMSWCSD